MRGACWNTACKWNRGHAVFSGGSQGKQWDFTKSERRQKAREGGRKNKPLLIIGSPPCDQWSIMQI